MRKCDDRWINVCRCEFNHYTGEKIGEKCIVGAGTVVIRNVDDNSKIVGNPGRIMWK